MNVKQFIKYVDSNVSTILVENKCIIKDISLGAISDDILGNIFENSITELQFTALTLDVVSGDYDFNSIKEMYQLNSNSEVVRKVKYEVLPHLNESLASVIKMSDIGEIPYTKDGVKDKINVTDINQKDEKDVQTKKNVMLKYLTNYFRDDVISSKQDKNKIEADGTEAKSLEDYIKLGFKKMVAFIFILNSDKLIKLINAKDREKSAKLNIIYNSYFISFRTELINYLGDNRIFKQALTGDTEGATKTVNEIKKEIERFYNAFTKDEKVEQAETKNDTTSNNTKDTTSSETKDTTSSETKDTTSSETPSKGIDLWNSGVMKNVLASILKYVTDSTANTTSDDKNNGINDNKKAELKFFDTWKTLFDELLSDIPKNIEKYNNNTLDLIFTTKDNKPNKQYNLKVVFKDGITDVEVKKQIEEKVMTINADSNIKDLIAFKINDSEAKATITPPSETPDNDTEKDLPKVEFNVQLPKDNTVKNILKKFLDEVEKSEDIRGDKGKVTLFGLYAYLITNEIKNKTIMFNNIDITNETSNFIQIGETNYATSNIRKNVTKIKSDIENATKISLFNSIGVFESEDKNQIETEGQTESDKPSEIQGETQSDVKIFNIDVTKIKEEFKYFIKNILSFFNKDSVENNLFFNILKYIKDLPIGDITFKINNQLFKSKKLEDETIEFLFKYIDKKTKTKTKEYVFNKFFFSIEQKTTLLVPDLNKKAKELSAENISNLTYISFIDKDVNLLDIKNVETDKDGETQVNTLTINVIKYSVLNSLYEAIQPTSGLIVQKIVKKRSDIEFTDNPFLQIFNFIKSNKVDSTLNINGVEISVVSIDKTNGGIFEGEINGEKITVGLQNNILKLPNENIMKYILTGDISRFYLMGDKKHTNLIDLIGGLKDDGEDISSDFHEILEMLLEYYDNNKNSLLASFNSIILSANDDLFKLLGKKINKKSILKLPELIHLFFLITSTITNKCIIEYNSYINEIVQLLIKRWSQNYLIFSKIYTKDENGNIKLLEGINKGRKNQYVQIINSKNEIKKHFSYWFNTGNIKLRNQLDTLGILNLINEEINIDDISPLLLKFLKDINNNNQTQQTNEVFQKIINRLSSGKPIFARSKDGGFEDKVVQNDFLWGIENNNVLSDIKNNVIKRLDLKDTSITDYIPINHITNDSEYYGGSYIVEENKKQTNAIIKGLKEIMNTKIKSPLRYNDILVIKNGESVQLNEFSDDIDLREVDFNGAYITISKDASKIMLKTINEKFKGSHINIRFENYLNKTSNMELLDTNLPEAFNWKGENIGEHKNIGERTKIGYVFNIIGFHKLVMKNLNVTIESIKFKQMLEEFEKFGDNNEFLIKFYGFVSEKDSEKLLYTNGIRSNNYKGKTDNTKVSKGRYIVGGIIQMAQDKTIDAQVKKFEPLTDKIQFEFSYEHTPTYSVSKGITMSNLKKLENAQLNGRIWYISPQFYYGFLPVKNSNANVFISTIAKKDKGKIGQFLNTMMSYKALQDGATVKQDEGKNFVRLSSGKQVKDKSKSSDNLFTHYYKNIEYTFLENLKYDTNKIVKSEHKEKVVQTKMENLILTDDEKSNILKDFILKTISYFTGKTLVIDDWDGDSVNKIKITDFKYVAKQIQKLSDTEQDNYINESKKQFKQFIDDLVNISGEKAENVKDEVDNRKGDYGTVELEKTHQSLNIMLKTIKSTFFKNDIDNFKIQIEKLQKFLILLNEYLDKFDDVTGNSIEDMISEHFYTVICKAKGIIDLLKEDIDNFELYFSKISSSERVLILDKLKNKATAYDKFDIRLYIDIQYVKGDLRFTSMLLDAFNQAGGLA